MKHKLRLTVILLASALGLVFAFTVAAQHGLEPGQPKKVAIKADNGGWWGRCNQCQKSVNDAYPDTIMIGEKTDTAKVPGQHFDMHKLKDGKVAFKADTGNWVGMCTDCIVNGAKKDFITVHVKGDNPDDLPSWAKFQVEKLGFDKVALKADNGKYVARCNSCSPGAAYPEQVTAHMEDTSEPSAQWELVDIED